MLKSMLSATICRRNCSRLRNTSVGSDCAWGRLCLHRSSLIRRLLSLGGGLLLFPMDVRVREPRKNGELLPRMRERERPMGVVVRLDGESRESGAPPALLLRPLLMGIGSVIRNDPLESSSATAILSDCVGDGAGERRAETTTASASSDGS